MANLLDRYKEAAGAEIINELYQIAQELKGIEVVHINSTKSGGDGAEIF